MSDLTLTRPLLEAANAAKAAIAFLPSEKKKALLLTMADCLEADTQAILEANAADVAAVQGSISPVMVDRLRLTAPRIAGMAAGMRAVAALPDPINQVRSFQCLPNGLEVQKLSVPLGVIAIIYESRPNVTSDAASLALQAGSVCVLRGGKESIRSNRAIVAALHRGLERCQLPTALVSLVTDTSRDSATELMEAVGYIDLLIPRGGASLIETCVQRSKVPCIQTGTGICHIFVDESADLDKAPDFLPRLRDRLVDQRTAQGLPPVELRLDAAAQAIIPGTPASEADFHREFLDYILAVKLVPDVEAAVEHINGHSTGHSEAILTEDLSRAYYFSHAVDSAAVYINASTRFTDGGEFGLGCEMGISTQKLHARGPMGLEELTSYKYVILGDGQTR